MKERKIRNTKERKKNKRKIVKNMGMRILKKINKKKNE